MKNLSFVWHRLVKDGQTCNRCGETFEELEKAVAKLKSSLLPLGIEVTIETEELTEEAFKANPSKSNEVWIAGKKVEDWLDAPIGMTPCSTVCEGSSCRTIEINGNSYETIPEELFIKAGLTAAGSILTCEASPTSNSCCSGSCS
jgi:hypothetical protein